MLFPKQEKVIYRIPSYHTTWIESDIRFKPLSPTPQNGQTQSKNSSPVSDELFGCI